MLKEERFWLFLFMNCLFLNVSSLDNSIHWVQVKVDQQSGNDSNQLDVFVFNEGGETLVRARLRSNATSCVVDGHLVKPLAGRIRLSKCDDQIRAVIHTNNGDELHLLPATNRSILEHFIFYLHAGQAAQLVQRLRNHRPKRSVQLYPSSHLLFLPDRLQRSNPYFCGTKMQGRAQVNIAVDLQCRGQGLINQQNSFHLVYEIQLAVFYDEFFAQRHNYSWQLMQLDLKILIRGMENHFLQSDFVSDVGLFQFITIYVGQYKAGRNMAGEKLLQSFQDFLAKERMRTNIKYHVAILFTGLNLLEYSAKEDRYEPFLEGIAAQTSICDFRSAVIVRRLSYEAISTAAHEMGHIFGAYHDQPTSGCGCLDNAFLMSSSSSLHKQVFSRCAKMNIAKKLQHHCLKVKTLNSSFVYGPRSDDLLAIGRKYAGEVIPLHVQCSLALNANFKALPIQNDLCAGLICYNDLFAVKIFPPLDGTPCNADFKLPMHCCSGQCLLSCTHFPVSLNTKQDSSYQNFSVSFHDLANLFVSSSELSSHTRSNAY